MTALNCPTNALALIVLVAANACQPPPAIEGRYVAQVDSATMSLDFNRAGFVMLDGFMRYEWQRSNDTVFVHGGPQTQTMVLEVRADSLIWSALKVVWIQER